MKHLSLTLIGSVGKGPRLREHPVLLYLTRRIRFILHTGCDEKTQSRSREKGGVQKTEADSLIYCALS